MQESPMQGLWSNYLLIEMFLQKSAKIFKGMLIEG